MKPEPFAEATKLGEPHVSPPTTAAPSCLNDAVTRSGENLLVAQPRRAEEALRESERKLARAMSLARLVDWEYDVASGLFILGDLYYAVHGTTSELEGGVAMSAETFVRKFVHPDDAHLIGEEIAKAVATEDPHYLSQLELRIFRRDGKLRHLLVHISCIKDALGRTIRLHGASQDITNRKKTEEDLRKLRLAVEQTPAIVMITNVSGDIEYVNPRFVEITGYSVAEAIGQNPRILKSGLHSPGFYKAMWDTLLQGNVWRGQMCNKKKIGEHYWESASISPIRDAKGKTTHFIAIKEDITDEKRLQHQLLEASRMAGMAEVATSVLHNVGNVLNSVNVSCSVIADMMRQSRIANLGKAVALLRDHEKDLAAFLTQDTKGTKLLAYLHSLAGHLTAKKAEIVNELASVIKNVNHIKEIVAMQQSYSKVCGISEIVPPVELIEDALRINGPSLNRHHIAVVREYSETQAILVEKHKVLQILVNLVSNANYSCNESRREDKRLTVRAEPNGNNQVSISIIDNGMGIPSENMARIFNHGFTTRRDGHGFGLHSGALAAKELGGDLTVHSDGVGKGATFTLELPLEPPRVAPAEFPAATSLESAPCSVSSTQ